MHTDSTTNAPKTQQAFFSAIPRGVLPYLATGRIKGREVALLTALLDYRSKGKSTVNPSQDAVARLLGWSEDTVQRAASKLRAVGLLTWTRLRDARGRLGKCIYDLSCLLSMLPKRDKSLPDAGSYPPDVRHGKAGHPRGAGKASIPQECGGSDIDSPCFVKADNSTPAPAEAPAPELLPPVVERLLSEGVQKTAALRLYQKHGAARCMAVLEAKAGKGAKNRAAWIVAALDRNWVLRADAAESRPKSQHTWRMPWAEDKPQAVARVSGEELRARLKQRGDGG